MNTSDNTAATPKKKYAKIIGTIIGIVLLLLLIVWIYNATTSKSQRADKAVPANQEQVNNLLIAKAYEILEKTNKNISIQKGRIDAVEAKNEEQDKINAENTTHFRDINSRIDTLTALTALILSKQQSAPAIVQTQPASNVASSNGGGNSNQNNGNLNSGGNGGNKGRYANPIKGPQIVLVDAVVTAVGTDLATGQPRTLKNAVKRYETTVPDGATIPIMKSGGWNDVVTITQSTN